jgi:hypothetical protein
MATHKLLAGADFRQPGNAEQFGKLGVSDTLPLMAAYHALGVLLSYNPKDEESYWQERQPTLTRFEGGEKLASYQSSNQLVSHSLSTQTTAALGVTIPQSLRLRAEEVIH